MSQAFIITGEPFPQKGKSGKIFFFSVKTLDIFYLLVYNESKILVGKFFLTHYESRAFIKMEDIHETNAGRNAGAKKDDCHDRL